jgi:hypothetical protein
MPPIELCLDNLRQTEVWNPQAAFIYYLKTTTNVVPAGKIIFEGISEYLSFGSCRVIGKGFLSWLA